MRRAGISLGVIAGVLLWLVAMVGALQLDTEDLRDWLADTMPVIDPVIGGIAVAGTVLALLLVFWLVHRSRRRPRHRVHPA